MSASIQAAFGGGHPAPNPDLLVDDGEAKAVGDDGAVTAEGFGDLHGVFVAFVEEHVGAFGATARRRHPPRSCEMEDVGGVGPEA